MSGTRVTCADVDAPESAMSKVIENDYLIVTDGTAQVTSVQAHGNGTHIITVKGCRRAPAVGSSR